MSLARGEGMVEYGLLLATIALVVLLGAGSFGQLVFAWFQALALRIVATGV
jgi:Flp pilus assembly pilin Flp